MSKGPGHVQREILRIIEGYYTDRGPKFTVEELSTAIYGDASRLHVREIRNVIRRTPLPDKWCWLLKKGQRGTLIAGVCLVKKPVFRRR